MKEVNLEVVKNIAISKAIYKITLKGDCKENYAGQFVEVKLNGFTLRRPFGVVDSDDKSLTLIYRVAGLGTKTMTSLKKGDVLNVLTSLGNGFNLDFAEKPLVIGGGVGIAPLYKLCKDLKEKGHTVNIILGFKDISEIYFEKEFRALGNVYICTDNGSYGYNGNVISCIKDNNIEFGYYYACGPMGMLRALKNFSDKGEMSLEARMGCGFGACMGCSIKTLHGYRRVCKEGPIFWASEVIFDA